MSPQVRRSEESEEKWLSSSLVRCYRWVCDALDGLIAQAEHIATEIAALETGILEWHRGNAASKRLATIPGIGPLTASAIAVIVPDASVFRSGGQFAAWLGLTPRAHSSGGYERLMGISKLGDGYLTGAGAGMVISPDRDASAD